MRRVLVTGAAGRVGRAVVRELKARGHFVRALDLVVVDASGTVAAFCTLWCDAANRVGLVEPVGCDPRFRRRGLMPQGWRR